MLRHNCDFADRPRYDIQVSVGSEHFSQFLQPQTAFEGHIRGITQTFCAQGIKEVVTRLFGSAQPRLQINELTTDISLGPAIRLPPHDPLDRQLRSSYEAT
jgi:hypothetical protein